MSIVNALDGLGIKYQEILNDLLSNMHSAMFKTNSLKVISVSGNNVENSYREIDITGITKIHNGVREILRETINVVDGITTQTTEQPTDNITVVKSGNKLLLHADDTSVSWSLSVNYVNRTNDNISEALRKDLLSWLLYLKLGDTANVIGCLRRIDTTSFNVVSENAHVRSRKIKQGRIKPCTL